jgi:hypothetical protein
VKRSSQPQRVSQAQLSRGRITKRTKEWQRRTKEIEEKYQQRFADLERKFRDQRAELDKQRNEEQGVEDAWEEIIGI